MSDINNRVESIKSKLENMINNLQLTDAKKYLQQFKEILPEEKDVISYEIVIDILEGNLDKAEKLSINSLTENTFSKDIIFNLGYIKELKGEFQEAYDLYMDCISLSDEISEELNQALIRIKEKGISLLETKRVVFFCKNGLDSFLGDIIEGLSSLYRIKKMIITNLEQLNVGMKWADICWFEWCDELVIYGSQLNMAREKKIICRLHSYEAFTPFINQVYWDNIDKAIFVAEHIKQIVIKQTNLKENQTVVIPNGVNIAKYNFKERNRGNKIAYVGYVNYKKGPMLLLQTFKYLFDINKEYELYIAGEFQDQRDYLYFQQMIVEMGLKKNIYFEGWQDDINMWLEDKDYIISTSLLESQHLSIMEGMAKGIKPLVHNFVGAKQIYPPKYVWNTIVEARNLIDSNYNSLEYRKFIEENYSLTKQIEEIKKLLKEKVKTTKEKSVFEFNYQNKLIRFNLTDLNDHIQKNILYNNNFYELVMLEDINKRVSRESVIIDIGANLGNHSVYFGRICESTVYAFEPQDEMFNLLINNIQLNELDNIFPYKLALGSSSSKGEIKLDDESNKGLARVVYNDVGNIQIETLDSILINRVNRIDVIKIDVEGMELEVLKGAKYIIEKFEPILYVEAATIEELNNLSSYLSSYGYQPRVRFNATPTYLFSKKDE